MWAGTRLSPGFMLVHGPRDDDEVAVVRGIVKASHAYAAGTISRAARNSRTATHSSHTTDHVRRSCSGWPWSVVSRPSSSGVALPPNAGCGSWSR